MPFAVSNAKANVLLVAVACVMSVVRCANEYNPFADYSRAGVSIISQSIDDGDTVAIFSTETLTVLVTVKELVRDFRLRAQHNRLWATADTTVDTTLFDEDPFEFLFSFYDTGWHTISLAATRSDGGSSRDTLRIYVRSPLEQDDIVAYDGDTVVLRTPGVSDRDVNYQWLFGASTQYTALTCSTRVALHAALFTGTGQLWVSDGTYNSPIDSFSFSLADTIPPSIVCVNEGFAGADTVYTGDSLFTFKVRIADGADQAVDSSSVNGAPFDGVAGTVYHKLFANMHTHRDTNPLDLNVYALDRFLFGNEARKAFHIVFSDTIAQTRDAEVVVTTPAQDTTTTSADSFYLSGTVVKHTRESLDATVLLFVNGTLNTTARSVTDSSNAWEWHVGLDQGTNVVRVTASRGLDGTVLDEKLRVIVRNPAAPDTGEPRIIDILADGTVADGQFSTKPAVVVRVRAYDEGVGIDTVSINGKKVAPESPGAAWYRDTVVLLHVPAGNEIVVSAADKSGNTTQKTAVVYRNRTAIAQHVPVSRSIAVDSLFADSVLAVDPDGDTIAYAVSSGPPLLALGSSSGTIRWTPTAADTGAQTVTIRIWDGYQPVYSTFSLHVYPADSLPPQPLRFATRSEDFPAYLEVGTDTLRLGLRVAAGSGVGPFFYSAQLLDKNSILIAESSESLLVWTPGASDTGYQQLRVIVTDALSDADTLYPRILVVPPNRPFGLSVNFSADTLPGGAVDLNARQGPDTLIFRIDDPDHYSTERHSVSILQWQAQSSTIIDSTVADSFCVGVDPSALDGYDTVIVTVTDRAGNSNTLKQAVYYGAPPAVAQGQSPSNGSIVPGAVAVLSWTGSDPDGDTITYDVWFGDSNGLTQRGSTTQTTYAVSDLTAATTYYWRIDANDWKSKTQGSLMFFTTAP